MWSGSIKPSLFQRYKVFSHKVLTAGFLRLTFSSVFTALRFEYGVQTASKCVTLAQIFCVSFQILTLIQTPVVSFRSGEAEALVLA